MKKKHDILLWFEFEAIIYCRCDMKIILLRSITWTLNFFYIKEFASSNALALTQCKKIEKREKKLQKIENAI